MRRLRVGSVFAVVIWSVACRDDAVAPTSNEGNAAAGSSRSATRPVAEGYATRGEVRSGYVIGRDRRPRQIEFEVHHGLAVAEGDIILGRADEVARSAQDARLRATDGPNLGVAIDGAVRRFFEPGVPGYGVVFYAIDPALTNPARVRNAIALVEAANVGVFFYPRVAEPNYLSFVPSDGCASFVGRIGGAQSVFLAPTCASGNAAHEILHALGMFHEQSRCDRDAFVEVLFANIQAGREFNFSRLCDGVTDYDTYAEGSIMHYPPNAFSANGLPTLRSRRGLDALMGQRDNLSATDVATLRALYLPSGVVPCRPIRPGGGCIERPIDERLSIITAGGPYAGPEGAVIGFSAGAPEPGLVYAWDFGDGDGFGSSSAEPIHAYADNGTYTVTLTLENGQGERVTSTTTANVANVAPIIFAGTRATIVSGQTFTFTAAFTDPGVRDAPWTFTIDWGTGTPSTGPGTRGIPITASRQYVQAGTYTVRFSVADKDGGVGTTSLQLTVTRIPATIDIQPEVVNANDRSNGVIRVALLTTPDLDARSVDPSSATLGDGSGTETPVERRNNGTPRASLDDVDHDGDLDLVLFFSRAGLAGAADLTAGATTLVLLADSRDGRQVRGEGTVRVVR